MSGNLWRLQKLISFLLYHLSLGRLPTVLGPLLVIVCGGSSIDMKQLANLKHKLQT